MKCPKCKAEMIIDEWNGWVWTCFNCDHIGRESTDEEVRVFETEIKDALETGDAFYKKTAGKYTFVYEL